MHECKLIPGKLSILPFAYVFILHCACIDQIFLYPTIHLTSIVYRHDITEMWFIIA